MVKWLLFVLVIYCGVACLGCSCTLIGCMDGASITIHRADGNTTPLTVDLEIDGDMVTCVNLIPQNSIQQCDDDRVSVTYLAKADCSGCEPNGTFLFYIAMTATPTRIAATASENGVVVGQQTFNPTYTVSYPNGELCDETGCRRWSGTWELP